MFNPIFTPNINSIHECALKNFTESITEHIVPSEVNIYAYRIGVGCLHVLKLDDQLDITITDGGTDIPDKSNCLDYLRVGHIQIGVLDSMDVTYMINHLLNTLKTKNENLNCFYQQHDKKYFDH